MAHDDLGAIARALDGVLDLDFRWRGESLDRLIDEEHAAVVDEVVRLYRAANWDVAVEASFSFYGERGSIDVFAWHPRLELVAVNEIKASVPEAGGTVIGVDRKSRLAPRIAHDRGWSCRGVARFLVIQDARTSRRRIAEHREIFAVAFPAGGRESLEWIRNPTLEPISGLILMPDSRPAGVRRRLTRKPPLPGSPERAG
jgi:hypothetical protein